MMLWGASDKSSRRTMLVLASALLVGAGATAAVAAPYAYVAHGCRQTSSCANGMVFVSNLTTHKVIGTVSVGKWPFGVAVTPAVGYKPISFGELVDARGPASTRESAGTLAAGGTPLSAAALSAPTLLAYKEFRVLQPLGSWCRTSTSFVVAAKNTRAFNSSNQITLQKLLGGLRAILGIECPKVRQIRLVGVVHHARVYEGTAGASGGWILRAPAAATRPKTGRPAERPWLWIVLGLLLLGVSSLVFMFLRKRKTAASPSGRTQYESAPEPRARPQATNRPATRLTQISDPTSVCPS